MRWLPNGTAKVQATSSQQVSLALLRFRGYLSAISADIQGIYLDFPPCLPRHSAFVDEWNP